MSGNHKCTAQSQKKLPIDITLEILEKSRTIKDRS